MNNIALKKTLNSFEKFLDWLLVTLLVIMGIIVTGITIFFGFFFTVLIVLPLNIVFYNYSKK